jgi:hypothetical protein
MNHSFIASALNSNQCARCRHTEIDHTSGATCESCGNTGTCELFVDILMCEDCLDAEKKAQALNNSPEKQAERINAHNNAINNHKHTIEESRKTDQSIQFKTDLFNARTIEIETLRNAINENPELTNKHFEFASELKTRLLHFQKVIFDAREVLEDATIAQKVIQEQLNLTANKLRQDERDKLKLADLTYQPAKPVIKKSISRPSAKKWTRADIREAAAEFKVPVDAVALMCTARNMLPKDAAFILNKQLHGE